MVKPINSFDGHHPTVDYGGKGERYGLARSILIGKIK
jgi:hypothetical protein